MNTQFSSSIAGQPTERPTRYRYVVLTYLAALTFILYLDRVCISQAGPEIQREMELNETELGYVFAAFTLSYGLCMSAAGRLGDRFGSRGVLVAIVTWWSVFTALTGASTGFLMLLAVRFIFGAGEAGALPNCARILSRWFPPESRGFPQGLLNTSALIGGAFAPTAAAFTMQWIGWRWMFVVFGLVGLVWGAVFWYGFRDDPAKHPRVNSAERDYIERGHVDRTEIEEQPRVPWRLVLRSRNIWLMGFIITCGSFASYLYMFWYPKYLQSGRGVGKEESGVLASFVLAGGALGSLAGGFLSDYVTRRTGGSRRSRSLIGAVTLSLAGLALWVSISRDRALWASLVTALAFFLSMLPIASWWGAVSDISGKHVATLFGLMNSMGIVGGIGSQIFFGRMADENAAMGLSRRAQWDPAFYYYVAVLFLGAIAWLFVDSRKSAVEEPVVKTERID